MDGETYLIWSSEHSGWWKPGSRGYSRFLSEAGRYTREQAIRICRDAIGRGFHLGQFAELPVRLADVEAFIAGSMMLPDWAVP